MRQQDILSIVINYMRQKKVRTTLTVFGIMLGPAAIVALLGLVGGFGAYITSELGSTGVSTIYVTPLPNFTLNNNVVHTISGMKGVKVALPYYTASGILTQGTQNTSVSIYAVNISAVPSIIPNLKLENGSIPSNGFYTAAVVGYDIAHPNITGARNVSLNQVITIKGSSGFGGFGGVSSTSTKSYSFLVHGIYAHFGQALFLSPDSSVFIPLSGGILLTNDTGKYSRVLISATNASSVSLVSSELAAEYGNNLKVITVSSILSEIESIESSISLILLAVASISLVVAFVSIVTTMYSSVTERTTEIGIMKALGFTSNKIMLVFLYESLIIGLIGGVFGVALGTVGSYAASAAMSHLSAGSPPSTTSAAPTSFRGSSSFGGGKVGPSGAGGFSGGGSFSGSSGFGSGFSSSGSSSISSNSINITPVISLQLIFEVILLTITIGVLAGIFPAWKASQLVPAEALRSN